MNGSAKIYVTKYGFMEIYVRVNVSESNNGSYESILMVVMFHEL